MGAESEGMSKNSFPRIGDGKTPDFVLMERIALGSEKAIDKSKRLLYFFRR